MTRAVNYLIDDDGHKFISFANHSSV